MEFTCHSMHGVLRVPFNHSHSFIHSFCIEHTYICMELIEQWERQALCIWISHSTQSLTFTLFGPHRQYCLTLYLCDDVGIHTNTYTSINWCQNLLKSNVNPHREALNWHKRTFSEDICAIQRWPDSLPMSNNTRNASLLAVGLRQ